MIPDQTFRCHFCKLSILVPIHWAADLLISGMPENRANVKKKNTTKKKGEFLNSPNLKSKVHHRRSRYLALFLHDVMFGWAATCEKQHVGMKQQSGNTNHIFGSFCCWGNSQCLLSTVHCDLRKTHCWQKKHWQDFSLEKKGGFIYIHSLGCLSLWGGGKQMVFQASDARWQSASTQLSHSGLLFVS